MERFICILRSHAFAAAALLVVACDTPDASPEVPPEEEDLVAPQSKTDTGYLSTLAVELKARVRGRVAVPATEDNLRNYIDPPPEELWRTKQIVTYQIQYGLMQLGNQALHLNLVSGDESRFDPRQEGDQVIIDYDVILEGIVSHAELEERNLDLDAMLQQSLEFIVPANPDGIMARVGDACATGVETAFLGDGNYFYYFDPHKPECDIELERGIVELESLAPPGEVYPEYDKLTADGKITVIVYFGAAGHDETVAENDVGMTEWQAFVGYLRGRDFDEVGSADEVTGKGMRFVRERAGLEEIVDVISPFDLAAVNRDEDGVFARLIPEHEIVLYNGHSFYGSLDVLWHPEIYAPGKYQIFFMNSCLSYQYYTKQIFQNKATESDPQGWALADVVNDTDSGLFINMAEFSRILLTNLLTGAEYGGRYGDHRFHWYAIVDALNQHALAVLRANPQLEDHEIMGVSGVRTNSFQLQ